MSLLIVLGALAFLMLVAYRGYSVILFAPVAALGAVLLTDPALVAPMFSSIFMEKMVGFVKSYFPVFMLGAVFGKVIELSGFSKSIVSAVIGVLGRERAVLSIVVVCAICAPSWATRWADAHLRRTFMKALRRPALTCANWEARLQANTASTGPLT
jgi:H+/gluconate symporter-like permease